jgi:hypothetical protein
LIGRRKLDKSHQENKPQNYLQKIGNKKFPLPIKDDCQYEGKSVALKERAKFLLMQIPQEWNGLCGGLANQVNFYFYSNMDIHKYP